MAENGDEEKLYDLDLSVNPYVDDYSTEILTGVSCVCSLICGLILLILIFRRHITLGTCHFMFVCLTLSDMMTAGGNLLGVINEFVNSMGNNSDLSQQSRSSNACLSVGFECKAQSFITTWSSMCCFLWTIVIEVYCFTCIWKSKHHIPLSHKAKFLLYFICWLVPLGIAIAAALNNVLGQDDSATSGGWCWITSCEENVTKHGRIFWMLFTGKLWEIISYLTISNLILLQIYKAYSRARKRKFCFAESEATIIIPDAQQPPSGTPAADTERYELQKFLFWIPMLLILARIWGTVRFFFAVTEIVRGNIPNSMVSANKVLLYFHGIGDSSQATCNFILAMIFIPRQILRSQNVSRRSSSLTEQSMYSVHSCSSNQPKLSAVNGAQERYNNVQRKALVQYVDYMD